jgi:hypothetical protein
MKMTKTAIDRTPAAADARLLELDGDESVIPTGDYCYTVLGFEEAKDGQPPRMKTALCPYWAANPEAPATLYGYCAKLKCGDYSEGEEATNLLFDQVKECGINQPDEEPEDILA